MKSKLCGIGILVILFAGITFWGGQVFAITLDGDLSDWGVTPFTHWAPTLAGTSYTVEDNTNRPGSDKFYETFDIEAMYVQDCQKYINFAVVSSWPYMYGTFYDESLFLDFSGRTMDEILVNGDYKYALDLSPLTVGVLSTKGVYEVNQDRLFTLPYENGSAYVFPVTVDLTMNPNGQGILQNAEYYHDLIGTYQVYNAFAGNIEPGIEPGTYILEGRVDKSIFVNEDLACGSSVETYFSNTSCIKDWITVGDTVDSPCANTPEPATLMLFGLGGLAAAFLRRTSRKTFV
ncbi:MAG: PEP-CTERM sorting domain-containing protein [Candidatus Omnitrophica bacterium]|nr:PEP-CTERM sorting domain-containing protein [Candidatus Omnitrophota bacterium]